MILGKRRDLHDHTVELLLKSEASALDIDNYLRTKGVKVTIQGIYKALRELISEDIVIKQNQKYSINNLWRSRILKIISNRNNFSLEEGEEVLYKFNNIFHLDSFWKHILFDIQNEIGKSPTLGWLPHQFWWYIEGREESEIEYEQQFKRNKIYYYALIGGKDEIDKKHKLFTQNEYHQIHLETKIPLNRRDHISVMGDYVVTTRIPSTTAKSIDLLYNTVSDEEIIKIKLSALLNKPVKITLTIEKSKQKADKLRGMFKKYFLVK
ncbi:MAG: hypothetical protein KBD26_00095 [Candidatus Pacebacteria bacterium]|nr:hypothetical protein [Candidatus Paceibacterota bacterium]MBP9772216.1 hypothetical protein [Candidatus Paceibacterota bacterium]